MVFLDDAQASMTAPSIIGSANARRSALVSSAGMFLVSFGVLALFWFTQVRGYYSPYSDEFSLFTHSARPFRPVFLEWFLKGFSQYFLPYPGWSVPATNFIRPVANAEYYLSSLLFGTHWSWYLLSTYCIQSALVASLVHLSLRHFALPKPIACSLGLICFVSPAFDYGALYSTAFAFDLLAALLVVLGLDQLLSARIVLASILFSLAIFTKETALFAPLSAAILVFRTSQLRKTHRIVALALLLLPYTVWISLRAIAFHTNAVGGIYALPTNQPSVYLYRVLKQFLRWPIPYEVPFRTSPFSPSDSAYLYVFAFMNLSFWAVLLYCGLCCLRTRIYDRICVGQDANRRGISDSATLLVKPALIFFCIGSSAILLLVPGLQPRFGATFIPLFALALLVFVRASQSIKLRIFGWALLILPPMINSAERAGRFPDELRLAHLQWSMAADYIKRISRASASTIYVLDDFSGGFSSTDSISRFAAYRGRIVRINDIVSPWYCNVQARVTVLGGERGPIKITSTLDSPCTSHTFVFSAVHYPSSGEELLRESEGTRIVYHGSPARRERFPLARSTISLEILGFPASSVLLVPDFASKDYREIALDQFR